MPAKIRLQRHGKKGRPYFHIVVADARAPRDGKYIERLGFYNPNTNPATIEIDVDGAVKWLGNGAQPTDTARAILSYKGVLYKNHLLKGVQKGAFSEEEAEKRFNAWLEEKQAKIEGKISNIAQAKEKESADRLAAEAEVNKTRAAAIAAANSELVEEAPAEEAADTSAEATASEEATATEEEAPAAEAATEEAPVEEPKAEEAKEEPKAEASAEATASKEEAAPVEEAPAAEEAKEEAKEEPKAEAAPAETSAEATASEEEAKEEKKEGE